MWQAQYRAAKLAQRMGSVLVDEYFAPTSSETEMAPEMPSAFSDMDRFHNWLETFVRGDVEVENVEDPDEVWRLQIEQAKKDTNLTGSLKTLREYAPPQMLFPSIEYTDRALDLWQDGYAKTLLSYAVQDIEQGVPSIIPTAVALQEDEFEEEPMMTQNCREVPRSSLQDRERVRLFSYPVSDLCSVRKCPTGETILFTAETEGIWCHMSPFWIFEDPHLATNCRLDLLVTADCIANVFDEYTSRISENTVYYTVRLRPGLEFVVQREVHMRRLLLSPSWKNANIEMTVYVCHSSEISSPALASLK